MDTYRAINTTNGMFYVGSTLNFESRKKEHLSSRHNLPFQNALRKHPEDFIWEVTTDDSDEPVLEQALLDMYFGTQLCYNLNPHASRPPSVHLFGEQNGMYGKTHTPESRSKMREAQLRRGPDSDLTRRKKSETKKGENNPNYGLYGDRRPGGGRPTVRKLYPS